MFSSFKDSLSDPMPAAEVEEEEWWKGIGFICVLLFFFFVFFSFLKYKLRFLCLPAPSTFSLSLSLVFGVHVFILFFGASDKQLLLLHDK